MKRIAVTASIFALSTGLANAAPVGFSFDAGKVIYVETSPFVPDSVKAVQGFQLGEPVLATFSLDSATPDLDPTEQRAEYFDPLGTITLTGRTSGTSITMRQGVNIQFDSIYEFDLRSDNTAPPADVFNLWDDIDYEATTPLMTDPEDLGGSLAELSALLNGANIFTVPNIALSSFATVDTYDEVFDFYPDLLEFGPVPHVPLPASALMLIGGLGMAVAFNRRKRPAHKV